MTRVTKYNMNNKENRKDKKKESGLVMGRPSSRTEMLPAGSGLNRAALHVMLGQGDYSQFQKANPLPLVPLLLGY